MFKYTPIAALVAALMSSTALAADLGGNCCADIEERVAELEATVAKKANRKVSLTVYGSVNYAVLHTEIDDLNLNETTLTNNPNAVTRFGFKGDAKISPDWSAGFLLEVGLGEADPAIEAGITGISLSDGVLNDGLVVRHSAVYLQHKQLGAFWLGKTSSATDGISEISIARVSNASTLLSLEPVSGAWLGGINLPFDGSRREVVKWVSPTVGGFTASAAWMGNNDDAWDAALRYAGEFGGFQVAAGVGYRKETSPFAAIMPATMSNEVETITGSASIMHMASGLFGNVAAGKVDGVAGSGTLISIPLLDFTLPFPFVDPQAVHVQGGIERNFLGFGATTLYGEWGRFEDKGVITDAVDFWGVGANQYIEAAAMDLYVGYRDYEDLNARHVVGGAVIRF